MNHTLTFRPTFYRIASNTPARKMSLLIYIGWDYLS